MLRVCGAFFCKRPRRFIAAFQTIFRTARLAAKIQSKESNLKITIRKFAAFSASLILLSLSYPLRAETISGNDVDDYYEEYEEVVEKERSQKKAKKSKGNPDDPYDSEKMKGKEDRSGIERAFNLNKFQKIEPFSLYAKNTFGKVLQKKGHLIHRAGTDIGGFVCRYDTSSYALQFAKESRASVRAAVERYLRDFEEKALDKNGKKTFRAYGNCDAYEDFGVFEGMMKEWSRPRVDLGYVFLKGNPYFCIRVPAHKNLNATTGNEYDKIRENVIEQRWYFTRAQAKHLAAFLSDANIDSLAEKETVPETESTEDSY